VKNKISSQGSTEVVTPRREERGGQKVLLVLDYSANWYNIIGSRRTQAGDKIRVEQCEWKDIHVEASSEHGMLVHIKKSEEPLHSAQNKDRITPPDCVLVRNFPADIHDNSFKNMVVAFLFANIPAINSIESIYRCMDRPLVYAEMLRIKKRQEASGHPHGFPLIPMNYYPNLKSSTQHLMEPVSYPCVVKVSSTHAGYGKIVAHSKEELKDIMCILALHNDYFTTEPFIEHEYEFRIQKIGSHYRAFRRNSDSHWKNNWGNLTFVDHEWRDEYKTWADLASQMFGGMDIIALDVLHTKEGKDYIIELNDTAPGLMYEHEEEDLEYIADLVVQKLSGASPDAPK